MTRRCAWEREYALWGKELVCRLIGAQRGKRERLGGVGLTSKRSILGEGKSTEYMAVCSNTAAQANDPGQGTCDGGVS